MPTLDAEPRGKITLTADLLSHLGISSGGRIKVARLPNGELEVRAARTKPAGASLLEVTGETLPNGKRDR
jgi:hypothetical protein